MSTPRNVIVVLGVFAVAFGAVVHLVGVGAGTDKLGRAVADQAAAAQVTYHCPSSCHIAGLFQRAR